MADHRISVHTFKTLDGRKIASVSLTDVDLMSQKGALYETRFYDNNGNGKLDTGDTRLDFYVGGDQGHSRRVSTDDLRNHDRLVSWGFKTGEYHRQYFENHDIQINKGFCDGFFDEHFKPGEKTRYAVNFSHPFSLKTKKEQTNHYPKGMAIEQKNPDPARCDIARGDFYFNFKGEDVSASLTHGELRAPDRFLLSYIIYLHNNNTGKVQQVSFQHIDIGK